jgi:hypothetical protein
MKPAPDRQREALIESLCLEAQVAAQEDGGLRTVVVCAGGRWCSGETGSGCPWCTRVVVSPDGSRARSEPCHA